MEQTDIIPVSLNDFSQMFITEQWAIINQLHLPALKNAHKLGKSDQFWRDWMWNNVTAEQHYATILKYLPVPESNEVAL
jgi:hypothetical protein